MSKDTLCLNDIFEKQKVLMQVIEKRVGTTGTISELACAMITEIGEWLNEEQSFKFWKVNKIMNKEKILEELVDVFFFLIQILIKLGFTAHDLYEGYMKKWEENIMRQRNKY